MKDLPELKIKLSAATRCYYEASCGGSQMTKDDMLIKLLDALIQSWLVTMTPVEIGSDVEKIRLLKEARAGIVGEPTPLVKQVYQEVFLRDVWNGAGTGS